MRRTALAFDPEELHSDAESLDDLYTDAEVLVARDQDRVGYGAIARKFDQVGDDERVDAFLLPVVIKNAESNLDVVGIREPYMLRVQTACERCVVPVDAQQRAVTPYAFAAAIRCSMT